MAPNDRDDILQGTLDMLVLKALQLGPMHGWGITQRLEQGSKSILQIGQGSLYPALYRLEEQGHITSAWGLSERQPARAVLFAHHRRPRTTGARAPSVVTGLAGR